MPGKKPVTIAVDIDNTIADTQGELMRRFGASVDSYPCPKVPEGFFGSKEGVDFFCSVKAFPGAALALRRLSGLGHRIVFLTCRPTAALSGTERWLRENGFVSDALLTGLSREGKARFAVECFQPVMVFEDDPVIVEGLSGLVPMVWVKDWPYNRRVPEDLAGVERFHSWREGLSLAVLPEIAVALGKGVERCPRLS